MVLPANRLRAAVVVLAGVIAAAPLSARAASHDKALVDLLSLIHHDPTPAELAAFGPNLEAKLIAIAQDPSVRSLSRVRAVACASRYGNDAAFHLAADLAASAATPRRLRLVGVWSLQHDFVARSATVGVLAKVLVDHDPGLRAAAVRALSAVGTPKALALLDQHRIAERNSVVRLALRQVLARRLPAGATLRRDGRVRRPVLQMSPQAGPGGAR